MYQSQLLGQVYLNEEIYLSTINYGNIMFLALSLSALEIAYTRFYEQNHIFPNLIHSVSRNNCNSKMLWRFLLLHIK